MKNKITIFAALPFLTLVSVHSQEKTFKVWEQGVPGAISDPSYKTETIYIESGKPRLMRVTDPTLDFYPTPAGKSGGTAVIICPGGSYGRLSIDSEGSDVALWLNELGISAFVLKYRLPSDAIMVDKSIGPLQDAQEAVRSVRRHSEEWNINPHHIGIMGFSAGGHLASTLSTHFDEKVYEAMDTTSARPDFAMLIYPVVSMDSTITHRLSRENLLGKNPSEQMLQRFSNERCASTLTPPSFIVHAADDKTVVVQNSINYVLALKKSGVPCELHVYQTGGHGFGLAKAGGTESSWPEACKQWLHARGLMQSRSIHPSRQTIDEQR